MIPRATDENMYRYIAKGCAAHTRFHASHSQKPRFRFSVEHYAGCVEYSTDGWLEKNRDELPRASSDLLAGGSFALIHDIRAFVRSEATSNSRRVGSVVSLSVDMVLVLVIAGHHSSSSSSTNTTTVLLLLLLLMLGHIHNHNRSWMLLLLILILILQPVVLLVLVVLPRESIRMMMKRIIMAMNSSSSNSRH